MATGKPVQFSDFIRSVEDAAYESYANVEGVRVADESSFAAMKKHLLSLYRGVEVQHSFEDDNGAVIDCIPIHQQASLRRGTVAAAPPALGNPKDRHAKNKAPFQSVKAIPQQVNGERNDRHGNARTCPKGSIPVVRLTLETLTRFETLQQFFRKTPRGGGAPPRRSSRGAAAGASHLYAHGYEITNNVGGHSYNNVWDPSVGNQIFSLSQHWYVGGSGSGLQTAEVGWQVYPALYNTSQPCLFIYWTADDYNTTGCYNLTCTAFVQTNSNWIFGGTISPVSVAGGDQYQLEMAFFLYQGNWWLYLGGTSASNAVGYYPTSIYQGGAMASNASSIDYGGEVVGTTSFPQMGSGQFASAGWEQACFQSGIYYFPTGGGASWADLSLSQAWPSCYTITSDTYDAPWGETIWFGGPGGNC